MEFQDWPLVIFSLLAQLAVGTYVVLGVIRFATKEEGKDSKFFRLFNTGWIGSFVVVAIALLISLTHLGTPLNAPYTILNMGSAWLSREILFGLLFAFFAGVFALFYWRQIGSKGLRGVLYVLGAVAGLGLVFSMSMIYRYIDTQPAWHTPWTTVMFYLTAGVLGCLAVLALITTGMLQGDYGKVMRGTTTAALIFIGCDLLAYLFYVLGLFNGIAAAQETAHLLVNEYSLLFALRILFIVLGAVLGGLYLYYLAKSENAKGLLISTAYAAFFLMLAAEVIGRFLFYAANVRIGI
ncbi:dimethyl sulfoxide reductase anchor subunit [bacterium]|nr:dimethyl sulfoxide reductase anchor subunit [bacterium]